MAENQYPEFVEGQTLTSQELNDLALFLDNRDRAVGRAVGFGVNCGLTGTVRSATQLTVRRGLAVDQRGEPLMLADDVNVALPPTITATPMTDPPTGDFDFLTPLPRTFSVVLEMQDLREETPDCTPGGCVGHAHLHTRTAQVRIAAGVLSTPRDNFEQDPLLKSRPLGITVGSTVTGDFDKLKVDIASRLENRGSQKVGRSPLIRPQDIAKLRGTMWKTSAAKGVKAYQAAWLNEIYFATLHLVRCQALFAVQCLRDAQRPGVVLGALTRGKSGWEFDCSRRHHWEPPVGLSLALLGGTCGDPCRAARDEVQALITGYSPPEPPPAAGRHKIPDAVVTCRKGQVMVRGVCRFPAQKSADARLEAILAADLDRAGLIAKHADPVVDPYPPVSFYEREQIYVGQGIGYTKEAVLEQFGAVFTGTQTQPGVQFIAEGAEATMVGLEPTSGASPSDIAVFTLDNSGKTIAAGRIPAAQRTREAMVAAPAALHSAALAMESASRAEELVETFEGGLAAVDLSVATVTAGLSALQDDQAALDAWQQGAAGTLDGLESMVDGKVTAKFDQEVRGVEDRLLKVESQVGVMSGARAIVTGNPAGRAGAPQQMWNKDAAEGIAEIGKTMILAMKSLDQVANSNFKRYTLAAERSVARFDVAIASEVPRDVELATLEMLDTVRTLVKSAGVDKSLGAQIDAQLREVKAMLL